MITGITVALFIHLLGVITLFIAIGLLQRGGAGLRTAATIDEMRLWLSLLATTRRMFPTALVLILVSGLYMADQIYGFSEPWIAVAIVTLLIMGGLGGGVVGRGLAAMGRALAGGDARSSDVAGLVANSATWIAAAALAGMALGVLWLMSVKPGWVQSIAVVVLLGVVGALVGSSQAGRDAGSGA
jgi:hypothetical protein